MNYWLSLIISSVLGFLCVNIFRARNRIDPALHLIASLGLGMALSAHIIFYTLFTVGQYNAGFIWFLHAALFLILLTASLRGPQAKAIANLGLLRRLRAPHRPATCLPWLRHGAGQGRSRGRRNDKILWLGIGILALLLVPLWREANFYPFGGWDAWACWNLKSKFIFLGQENWKNMLDPLMWRSNNQYPFLLPLMNVWGWNFYGSFSPLVPMFNTILFTFLTAMLMFVSLRRLNGKLFSVVPPLVLFTIPFINTLSISQYSDIVLAFYLLGSFVFLIAAHEKKNIALAILAGCFCGIMSFTKTEGTLASVVIAGLSVPYFWKNKNTQPLLGPFLGAVAVSSLPTVLFQLFWAPENTSFINGLTSPSNPVTFVRLKMIFIFLCVELISPKWTGLWVLLMCGLLLGKIRSFKNGLGIVPAFLVLYLGCTLAYYLINTHYEIIWWLQNTLNRVLYTALPTIVWWIFYALWSEQKKTT